MGFLKGRNQMSRLSKYVKEKIVKVLVAALVVGTVAGNEGITAQAATNTVDTFETAVLDIHMHLFYTRMNIRILHTLKVILQWEQWMEQ